MPQAERRAGRGVAGQDDAAAVGVEGNQVVGGRIEAGRRPFRHRDGVAGIARVVVENVRPRAQLHRWAVNVRCFRVDGE